MSTGVVVVLAFALVIPVVLGMVGAIHITVKRDWPLPAVVLLALTILAFGIWGAGTVLTEIVVP